MDIESNPLNQGHQAEPSAPNQAEPAAPSIPNRVVPAARTEPNPPNQAPSRAEPTETSHLYAAVRPLICGRTNAALLASDGLTAAGIYPVTFFIPASPTAAKKRLVSRQLP